MPIQFGPETLPGFPIVQGGVQPACSGKRDRQPDRREAERQQTTENAADPMLTLVPEHGRARLVARLDGEADGLRIFRFDIRLRGSSDEETPFFED